ncbi:MAG: recombination regulator RecX [Natronospirillum sp.]|uniref:regulatory protein RecX n=1 Tax=Natronospirillum sp. TaxID=2812955 RepID=UPI0025FFD7DE|nr:regulatory protein RecX [Natronospirillum sp.]MCH8551599.1 recombination regulator RecX [Natronospirillum sp.]
MAEPDFDPKEAGPDGKTGQQKSPRHAAMDLLARREYSQRELMERLHRKYPDLAAEELGTVVETLADQGLQSDQRFAESYVRLRVSRGQGPAKIAWELQQRGISDDAAGSLLAQWDWQQQAAQVLERKFGHTSPNDLPEKARMSRFLQQRGFHWQHLEDALD